MEKTVEHMDFVSEAKSRKQEIQQLLTTCRDNQHVALYINENGGYTLSKIADGHTLAGPFAPVIMRFGCKSKSITEIESIIDNYDQFTC